MGIAKQGLRPSAQLQQAQAQPPVPWPAAWRQEQPHATTKWQDSCWCNTCTMEWFCNCGRTGSMVKVVCEMPRTKLLAWRCLLKPLVFSVLIQFMQKEVRYLLVLGWFSKNEGGAISPGSGAIFKEWRRCNISWFWGGRKKNKRTHVFFWGVGVPTWCSIVRAAASLVPTPMPICKGLSNRAGRKTEDCCHQYLLVLGWFSKNEGGAISPGFVVIFTEWRISGTQTVPINQAGSTQLTKPHWVSQCLQHQMLLMLWYHHLQHQMLLKVYELHQHQKRRLQLSLQEPFRQ